MSFKAPRDFGDPSKWDFIATTPKAITPEIGGLCSTLIEKWFADVQLPPVPVFVPIQPIVRREQGFGRCYPLVSSVNIPGTRIVHGFSIWEMPDIYLTNEHHAVLQMADGSLLDVTPSMGGEKKILFLPVRYREELHIIEEDDRLPPKPLFVPLHDHPLIREAVELKSQLDTLLVQGKGDTVLYKSIDDWVCRNIIKFQRIMQERQEKNKAREKKRKERKRKR